MVFNCELAGENEEHAAAEQVDEASAELAVFKELAMDGWKNAGCKINDCNYAHKDKIFLHVGIEPDISIVEDRVAELRNNADNNCGKVAAIAKDVGEVGGLQDHKNEAGDRSCKEAVFIGFATGAKLALVVFGADLAVLIEAFDYD